MSHEIAKRNTFVAPAPTTAIQRFSAPLVHDSAQHIIGVPITATQHIEVRTGGVDRAKGFLIASVPNTFAFALAVAIAGVILTGLTLTGAIVTLFVTFAAFQLVAYIATLLLSAEGVSWYEARRKWNVVDREQRARWQHYNRLNGGE